MQNRAKWMGVSFLVLSAAFGVGSVLHLQSTGEPSRSPRGSTDAAEATRGRILFKEGVAYRYDVRWTESTEVDLGLGQPPTRGALTLSGTLAVRGLRHDAEGFLLGVSFASLAKHDLVVQGTAVLPTDEIANKMLTGHEAVVALDPSGVVTGVFFQPASPSAFRDAMTALVGRMEVTTPLGSPTTWSGAARTPAATVELSYARGKNGLSIARDHVAIKELRLVPSALAFDAQKSVRGQGTVTLKADGTLESVTDQEELGVTKADRAVATSKTSFELTLSGTSPFAREPLPRLAAMMRRAPGEAEASVDRERSAD